METRFKLRAWNVEHRFMIPASDVIQYEIDVMKLVGNAYRIVSDKEFILMGAIKINEVEIYEGDIHLEKAIVDKKEITAYYPIVYENGAYWIDESFAKDGTCLTLLCEYEIPINIVGNIYENSELLKNKN